MGDTADVAGLLAASEMFGALEHGVLRQLADAWEPVRVLGGQWVIREGEPGDAMYLVVSGRLRVTVDGDDGPVLLREMGRGQVLGEMALVDDAPRTASVRAIRDTSLLRLAADRFRALIEEQPAVLMAVTRLLVRRLRSTTTEPAPRASVRTLAVVPAGPTVDAGDVARRLASGLGPDPVALLDDRMAAEHLGDLVAPDPAGEHALLSHLEQLERAHRYVVHLAGGTGDAWTERCVRQADRVLFVVDADAGAAAVRPARDAAARLAGDRPLDLVLVHPRWCDRPAGTARWLDDGVSYASHHHVRAGLDADHARVARLLTGRGVGLTLGGGGPRGFAHVGALRALVEAGLPIDSVGGTSIGSIMGGFQATGWDQATIEARVIEGFVTSGRVIDRTLPVVSLSSARRIERLLQSDQFFGDSDLEDLWLPYFAVSTNLSRAEVVVDERGPAWLAMRTSISIPGVLPPVCRGGDLLVDGGIMNNLPVDVMTDRLGGGVHVAVDLEPPVDLRVREPFPSALSGWTVAARRLNPLRAAPRIPGPLEVLLRSRAASSRMVLEEKLSQVPVDLYLAPPVGGYDLLDFTVAEELIERGYQYTVDCLEQADGRVRDALESAP